MTTLIFPLKKCCQILRQRSKGPSGGAAATKGGYAGFGLAGFASAVLLITFAALLGGIILLLISGGSFVTVGLSSLTGRKKRDLNTEESSGWLDTVGSFILNALEKGYNADHSQ